MQTEIIRRTWSATLARAAQHPSRVFGLLGAAALLMLAGWATAANLGPNPREIAAVAGDANDADAEEGELSVGAASSHTPLADLPPFTEAVGSGGAITRRALIRTTIPQRPPVVIVKYQVQQGDTLFGIADKFGVKPETVLWGNFDLLQDNPHSLRPGQALNILPVDGTYYEWNESDGLNAVAAFFGVTAQDIIDWPGNGLPQDLDLFNPQIEPGTGLVIPGGRREFVSRRAPRITRANPAVARLAGPGACGSISDGPIGEGFFIWPTTAEYLSGTPFTSYHPGIDIAGSTGNAIYASASGVVVYAGWSDYGYGLMVVIDHGDGWQTLYAHLSQINVDCGQAVEQGSMLGLAGSTGNSTGSHLHFEILNSAYGRVNPWSHLP